MDKITFLSSNTTIVRYAYSPIHDFINISNGNTLKEVPCLAVFHHINRTYSLVPDEINLMIKSRNSSTAEAIVSYLKSDRKQIQPSEPSVSDYIHRVPVPLVGTNHDSFVVNESFDSVVLYVAEISAMSIQFLKMFIGLAYQFDQSNIHQIKFGVINVTSNAANFPIIPVFPHIHIYPSTNKSNDRIYFSQHSKNSLLCYLKRYASVDIPFKCFEETRHELTSEIFQIYADIQFLDEFGKIKANERINEIAPLIDFNTTQMEEIIQQKEINKSTQSNQFHEL